MQQWTRHVEHWGRKKETENDESDREIHELSADKELLRRSSRSG